MRFIWNEDHYIIKAKRKDSGKWEVIGTCHLRAKDDIKAGKLELIQWVKP